MDHGVRNDFFRALIHAKLLIPTPALGIVGRSPAFEAVALGVDGLVRDVSLASGASEWCFPPVVSKQIVQRAGYMAKFADLCGVIHSFKGSDADQLGLLAAVEAGEAWTPFLEQTDLTLCPAACYPLFPALSGRLPRDGVRATLSSYVFRREPSQNPARLQCFRQREDIRVGRIDEVVEWRDKWLARGVTLLEELGLDVQLTNATDAFFGRVGKFLAHNQLAQRSKSELSASIFDPERRDAIASINLHNDHFTRAFEIALPDSQATISGCVGFGLERVALALFRVHGLDVNVWPADVRKRLFRS